MKNLLLAPMLALAACVSPGDGLVPVESTGPVARTIERVIVRAEAYASQPPEGVTLPDDASEIVLAAAQGARIMTAGPVVSGAMLYVVMKPLMDFHDSMVVLDSTLEPDEQATYLEDTARLRSLFDAVSIHSN